MLIVNHLLERVHLEGHSQLRYQFIANLHAIETRSILFLTRCDKNNIIGWIKGDSKTGFYSKQLKMKQNTAYVKADI